MNPFVSIIVPYYQSENYISRCVDSILTQTFGDFELLLVNDGSTDRGGEICDGYARVDKRVRVFHRPHLGVSAARQFGIDSAQGEYTLFCDSDDWIEPNLLEELRKKTKDASYDMVLFDSWREDQCSRKIRKQILFGWDVSWRRIGLFDQISHVLWDKLIRRDVYLKYNISFPKDMNYAEDMYVVFTMFSYPLQIGYIEKAFYHYDKIANKNSLTRFPCCKDNLESLMKVIDYIEKIGSDKMIRKIIRDKSHAVVSAYRSGRYGFSELKRIYPESHGRVVLHGLRRPIERMDIVMLGLKLKFFW